MLLDILALILFTTLKLKKLKRNKTKFLIKNSPIRENKTIDNKLSVSKPLKKISKNSKG